MPVAIAGQHNAFASSFEAPASWPNSWTAQAPCASAPQPLGSASTAQAQQYCAESLRLSQPVPRPRRRGCLHCISCTGAVTHCHSTTVRCAAEMPEYAEWWPAGLASPTVYFHLRARQLEHLARQASRHPHQFRRADETHSEPSALLLRRGQAPMRVAVPAAFTNVSQTDNTVQLLAVHAVPLSRAAAPPSCAGRPPAPAPHPAAPAPGPPRPLMRTLSGSRRAPDDQLPPGSAADADAKRCRVARSSSSGGGALVAPLFEPRALPGHVLVAPRLHPAQLRCMLGGAAAPADALMHAAGAVALQPLCPLGVLTPPVAAPGRCAVAAAAAAACGSDVSPGTVLLSSRASSELSGVPSGSSMLSVHSAPALAGPSAMLISPQPVGWQHAGAVLQPERSPHVQYQPQHQYQVQQYQEQYQPGWLPSDHWAVAAAPSVAGPYSAAAAVSAGAGVGTTCTRQYALRQYAIKAEQAYQCHQVVPVRGDDAAAAGDAGPWALLRSLAGIACKASHS